MPGPMSTGTKLRFNALNAALKAAGEETRLRVLALLAEAELTVSDLTDILRQSQPRISRHLKLLAEAGSDRALPRGHLGLLPAGRARRRRRTCARAARAARSGRPDHRARPRPACLGAAGARRRGAGLLSARTPPNGTASASCTWPTPRWKTAIRAALAGKPFRSLLDLGTGTGRMLELFGAEIERGLGLDLSLDMLLLARDRLERAGLKHCSVRQGDIYDLPLANDSFDVVIVHQVLHFLDDGARAIKEAARVLRPGGRLLVVDFAPHEQEFLREQFAHRRLGFRAGDRGAMDDRVRARAGACTRALAAEPGSDGKIAVSLWLARDVRALMAQPAQREVA